MKIIIFLVLAGLSLAQKDIKCEKETREAHACLLYAIENFREFLKSFTIYLCDYKGLFNDSGNLKNYNKTAKDLIQTLACSGCIAKQFLNDGYTFEDLLGNIGVLIKEFGVPIGKISDILDFGQPLVDFFCYLEGGTLTSNCATSITERDVPDDVTKLNTLFCQSDVDALSEHDIITVLADLSCLGDEALHTGNALENLLKERYGEKLEPALKDIFTSLKEILLASKITQKLGCGWTEVVLGDKSVTDVLGEGPAIEVSSGEAPATGVSGEGPATDVSGEAPATDGLGDGPPDDSPFP